MDPISPGDWLQYWVHLVSIGLTAGSFVAADYLPTGRVPFFIASSQFQNYQPVAHPGHISVQVFY